MLWGIGKRTRFLHGGRASSLREATMLHDGDAAPVTGRFRQLTAEDQGAIVTFLATL